MTAQNKLWWEVVFTFLKPATILQKCLRDLQVLPLLLKDDHSLLWTIPEKSLIEIVKWGTENTAAFPKLTGFGQSRRICSHRVAPLSKSACWLFQLNSGWSPAGTPAARRVTKQSREKPTPEMTHFVAKYADKGNKCGFRILPTLRAPTPCDNHKWIELSLKKRFFYHWVSPRFKYGMKLFKYLWIIHQI